MEKRKVHYQQRLQILFVTVFLLFTLLIVRLGYVQILHGEQFEAQLASAQERPIQTDAPRGLMLDRYGNVVVDNEVEFSLTYMMPSTNTSSAVLLDVAQKLESFLEIDTSNVTERDKKDYLLLTMDEKERRQLLDSDKRNNELSNADVYQLELDAITEEQLEALSEKDMAVIAVYREMSQGTATAPQRIKRNVTEEEAHLIIEHLAELPGVDIQLDSRRSYPYGSSLRSIFGSVNFIPGEKVDGYIARGYQRNEIVGVSYLEAQYEEMLKGIKAVRTQSEAGKRQQHSGQRGNDLILSIDMELQQKLEAIIENEMINAGRHSFIEDRSAYAVILNPKSGDVLALAGFLDSGDGTNSADHLGVVNKGFEMGSSIKAASVLTGFHEGVAQPGTQFNDRTIYLPSTPPKSTWNKTGFGWIDDLYALEQSSNVYMFEIGMRLANCYYSAPHTPCGWTSETIAEAYQTVRNSFSQFGLGTDTGIDLPTYFNGMEGENTNGGKLLDLMIGQYDTYTTLQLAQYIATIANDGYRMKLTLVKEVREPTTNPEEPGAVIQQFEPAVLNRIEMSDEHLERVKAGLRRVVTHGNAAARFAEIPQYEVAGKTGTAQVKIAVGEERKTVIDGETQTFVGFAPYSDPEIAFAVVVPHAKLDRHGARQGMAQHIAREIVKAYFD